MALECILNFNFEKQHESTVDWFKNELRELLVLDKLLVVLKCLLNQYQNEKQNTSHSNHSLLKKFSKYLNLIIAATQHPIVFESASKNEMKSEKMNGIESPDCINGTPEESASALNQRYLIEYQDNFLLDLVNESLCIFYKDLESLLKLEHAKSLVVPHHKALKNIICNSIKQTFLVMINLTHKNCNF